MKPDRIKISHEFPGLWLAVEIPIAPDEDVIQQFKSGKSLLVEAYRELCEPTLVPISEALGITQVDKLENRVEILVGDISNCTTLNELSSFKLLATMQGGKIKEAYEIKEFELQKTQKQ